MALRAAASCSIDCFTGVAVSTADLDRFLPFVSCQGQALGLGRISDVDSVISSSSGGCSYTCVPEKGRQGTLLQM